MQEKFENRSVILRSDQAFELVYLVIAFRPDFLRRQPVNSHHEHIFVMRTIENGDRASGRDVWVHPPKEIMRKILFRWFFEVNRDATGRIHSGQDMADYAVFTSSVESL